MPDVEACQLMLRPLFLTQEQFWHAQTGRKLGTTMVQPKDMWNNLQGRSYMIRIRWHSARLDIVDVAAHK